MSRGPDEYRSTARPCAAPPDNPSDGPTRALSERLRPRARGPRFGTSGAARVSTGLRACGARFGTG
ncbi:MULTISPECIES: hypothetical protein, partial [unclassified Streptomyces]|uniref:hypothetical protein n=1 Tax=unclassified Streptomyces TaxID=2593676 RepID=UPI001C63060B